MATDVYTIVTDRIIQLLEQGICPWRSPYRYGLPRNIVSKQCYNGINSILLAGMGMYRQYKSHYWLTYNQAGNFGGKVRKGEHGCPIIYFNMRDYDTGAQDENGDPVIDKVPFIRYYTVFNLDQCENIDLDKAGVNVSNDAIVDAEQVIANMPNRPKMVSTNQSVAFYRRSDDTLNLPDINNFVSSDAYYSTAFHELVHSTGHESRLDRKSLRDLMSMEERDRAYSKEELIAELGSSMLSAHCNILDEHILENNAAYCASWIKHLKEKDNKKLLVQAGAAAQKAINYILNIQSE